MNLDALTVYTYYDQSVYDVFVQNILSFIRYTEGTIDLRILCNTEPPKFVHKTLSNKVRSVQIVRIFDQDFKFTDYLSIMLEIVDSSYLYVDPKLRFINPVTFDRTSCVFFSNSQGIVSTKLWFLRSTPAIDSIKFKLREMSASRKVNSSDLTFLISVNFLLNKDIIQRAVLSGKALTDQSFINPTPMNLCIDLSECIGKNYVKLESYLTGLNSKRTKTIGLLPPPIKKILDAGLNALKPKISSNYEYQKEFNNPGQPTVIVPVYKNASKLRSCLQSISQSGEPTSFNLLVINDSPNDDEVNSVLTEFEETFKKSYQNQSQYRYLINSFNLGFIKTVNLAISKCLGDVIILNSDTVVSNDWITRLIEYKKFPNIASVTPLSNSASICSFPKFNIDQSHYRGLTPNQIDTVFRRLHFSLCHESPTGVGFCMLMTREAIENIGVFDSVQFSVGYGEENDWCMRALAAGFKNLIAPNIYVGHDHGSSFKDIKNLQQIRFNNANALITKHPTYSNKIKEYFSKKDLLKLTPILTHSLDHEFFEKIPGSTIVMVTHQLGGGSTKFSIDLQTQYKENGINVILISRTADTKSIVVSSGDKSYQFQYSKSALLAILYVLGPDSIMLNHSITWELDELFDVFMQLSIPYSIYLHDFYWVCPIINLVNSSGSFCGGETRTRVCESCFQQADILTKSRSEKVINRIGVSGWRRIAYDLFNKSTEIVAPSDNTKSMYARYFPEFESKINVLERPMNSTLTNSFNRSTLKSNTLKVVVLGGISKIKGSQIVYELNDLIKSQSLPIDLTVIGSIVPRTGRSQSSNLQVTGHYDQSQLFDMLSKHEPMIGLIPSICPETYSYTTSELFCNTIPVMCFNLGAPADRIREIDAGWIVDEISATAILSKLIELNSNRQEIVNKHNNLKRTFIKK